MSKWETRLEQARAHVGQAWSPQRTEAALTGAASKRRRRRSLRISAAAAVVVAAGAALWPQLAFRSELPPGFGELSFLDGSRAALLMPDTRVVVERQTSDEVIARLDQGTARFDVTRSPSRVFRVRAGGVTITVLGTAFTVDRGLAQVRVTVHRGRVRVEAAQQTRELLAGDEADFAQPPPVEVPAAPAPKAEAAAAEPSDDAEAAVDPPEAPAAGQRPLRPARWRVLAERGGFEDAYQLLRRQSAAAVRDVPDELLLAADVGRKSGHFEAAVPYLRRVIRRYPHDERAPLAAMTLGRIYLEHLDSPKAAADAFAVARRLSPHHPLAEDALAREVECWSRAGDADQARKRAAEYVREYPDGGRREAVLRLAEPR